MKVRTWVLSFAFFTSMTSFAATNVSSIAKSPNGDLIIPVGVEAVLDNPAGGGKSIDAKILRIQGTLKCPNDGNFSIVAETILVSGTFECGRSEAKFNGRLDIQLKDNASNRPQRVGLQPENYRGFIIESGGTLRLQAPSPTMMVKLNATAEAGVNRIVVDGNISNWSVNDEIAISTTSYDPLGHEKFKISRIEGNQITLDGVIHHRHWGKIQSLAVGAQVPQILDQRAEVVNLSRKIKISPLDTTGSLNFYIADSQLGAHLMVHNGGTSKIDGVHFDSMGQAGILARYPMHWHEGGDGGDGQYLRNSVVENSFQRCVVIHATNKVRVENNICLKFRGHGFFFEEGTEVDNILDGNIGMAGMKPFLENHLLRSEDPSGRGLDQDRFAPGSVYWIANPRTKVTNNIASGFEGSGFWNSFEDKKVAIDGGVMAIDNINTPAGNFANNVAHSGKVGFTWDGAKDSSDHPEDVTANNPLNPFPSAESETDVGDRTIGAHHYSPTAIPVFSNLVAYKNINSGIYFRGNTAVYDRAVLADNGMSLFFAYNQITKNSVIVGFSENNDAEIKKYLVDNRNMQQVGVVLYDGPFELENLDFINFNGLSTYDSNAQVPFWGGGGSEKFVNITSKIRFSPRRPPLIASYGEAWPEVKHTNLIRDLDGSLTGKQGGALLAPAQMIARSAECVDQASFPLFSICPAEPKVGVLEGSLTPENETGNDNIWKQFGSLWYVVKRNDGVESFPGSDRETFVAKAKDSNALHTKIYLINGRNFAYEMILLPNQQAGIKEFNHTRGRTDLRIGWGGEDQSVGRSPLIKMTGFGSQCHITGATRVSATNTATAIREILGSTEGKYYSVGNDLYFTIGDPGHAMKSTLAGQGVSKQRNRKEYVGCDANLIEGFVSEPLPRPELLNSNQSTVADEGTPPAVITTTTSTTTSTGSGSTSNGNNTNTNGGGTATPATGNTGTGFFGFFRRGVTPVQVAASPNSNSGGDGGNSGANTTSANSNNNSAANSNEDGSGISNTSGSITTSATSTSGGIGGNNEAVTIGTDTSVAGTTVTPQTGTNSNGDTPVMSRADAQARVRAAFQNALGRDPTSDELLAYTHFVEIGQDSVLNSAITRIQQNNAAIQAEIAAGAAAAAANGQANVQNPGVTPVTPVSPGPGPASEPVIGDIVGWIDMVDASGRVGGWLCAPRFEGSIAFHVYAEGPAGSVAGMANFLVDGVADLPNESQVDSECQTSGIGHRFNIQVPAAKMAEWAGKAVFVHGMAPDGEPSGRQNLLISGSGSYSLP